MRFLDHTQRRTTVGRTRLDQWPACRRDLYLTTTQHSQQTDIHATGGIRTHNSSRRAAADLRLGPRGQLDRLTLLLSKEPRFQTSIASIDSPHLKDFTLRNSRLAPFFKENEKKIEVINFFFFKCVPETFLWELERNQMKDYCWAITQAMETVRCGRLRYTLLDFGLPTELPCTNTYS